MAQIVLTALAYLQNTIKSANEDTYNTYNKKFRSLGAAPQSKCLALKNKQARRRDNYTS